MPTNFDTNFEQACKLLNIPSDRIGLVKRNIELRGKLKIAMETLTGVQLATHNTFQHPGPADRCDRSTCADIRRVRDVLQP